MTETDIEIQELRRNLNATESALRWTRARLDKVSADYRRLQDLCASLEKTIVKLGATIAAFDERTEK